MRKVTLNKILRETTAGANIYNDTEEPGEGAAVQTPTVVTVKTVINVDNIRCFNPRRDDKPGTRITFVDGGGFAVTESFDEVNALTDLPAPATTNGNGNGSRTRR